jgi:hypothetical protein
MHTIPSQRLPVATNEHFSMVPLTLPELRPKEHRFPEDCWDCTTHSCEDYIDVTMRFVSGNVHGVEYRLGEGPPAWEDLVQASQLLVWKYLDNMRAMPDWRNGKVPAGLLRVTFAEEGNVPVHLLQGFEHPDRDAIVQNPTGEALWYVPVHRY